MYSNSNAVEGMGRERELFKVTNIWRWGLWRVGWCGLEDDSLFTPEVSDLVVEAFHASLGG